MTRAAMITYAVAGLAVAGLVVLAAAPVVAAVAAGGQSRPTTQSAPEPTPDPSPTPPPTTDADRVIWLGDGVSVKARELPKGCTTYSKIEIFEVSARSYGRLVGEAADRGPSAGATGTVKRDASGNIVSYAASPGDDIWSIGDRLCTNPLMVGRYNHIGSGPGDHDLQPGETVVIRPGMNVEWVPGTG